MVFFFVICLSLDTELSPSCTPRSCSPLPPSLLLWYQTSPTCPFSVPPAEPLQPHRRIGTNFGKKTQTNQNPKTTGGSLSFAALTSPRSPSPVLSPGGQDPSPPAALSLFLSIKLLLAPAAPPVFFSLRPPSRRRLAVTGTDAAFRRGAMSGRAAEPPPDATLRRWER